MPLNAEEKNELKSMYARIAEASKADAAGVEASFLEMFNKETHEELVQMLAFTTIALLETNSELTALKNAIESATAKRAAIAERDRNGPRIIL
jgi:hypothetical protein